MKTVMARGIEIGTGIPKICVPIVGVTQEEIYESARRIAESKADIAEWRADWYDDVEKEGKATETMEILRKILGEIPLLFTFRTLKEGGERKISDQMYIKLNEEAAAGRFADLIDVELFTGDEQVRNIIEKAHASGRKVIVSNHDFSATPDEGEMIGRLRKMQELGADIAKIAVMPLNRNDVLKLLSATEKAAEEMNCPLITMSMGGTGLISRVCGETFGSAVTFGALGKASAPGQMEAEQLRKVLEILHSAQK